MAEVGRRLNTFHDRSGLVTVSVFSIQADTPQQHFHDFGVNVSPEMVCVGGGGTAAEMPNGALLTASYPIPGLTGWAVSSKDHEVPNPHLLTAYAIGMEVKGMTRAQLGDNFITAQAASATAAHPEAIVSIPDDYSLLSGGLRVDWHGVGNLATASFPGQARNTWIARSKDHDFSDPSKLTVYAIGIKRDLGGFLPREKGAFTTFQKVDSAEAPHPSSEAEVAPGWALCGGGAEVHWKNNGNLL
jgi:hypothetical protein